jgi:hypothetical protein
LANIEQMQANMQHSLKEIHLFAPCGEQFQRKKMFMNFVFFRGAGMTKMALQREGHCRGMLEFFVTYYVTHHIELGIKSQNKLLRNCTK